MQKLSDIEKQKLIAVIIVSLLGLLSSFSFTMTVFAWGTGDATIYYLLFCPTFLVTTILVISKVHFAYFPTIIIAVVYRGGLLNRKAGNYPIFRFCNGILILALVLPYLDLLAIKQRSHNAYIGQLTSIFQ